MRITRPTKNASPAERGAYLNMIEMALDAAGIAPGEEFLVMRPRDDVRPTARRSDPSTSHEAAAAVAGNLNETQAAVLRVLRDFPDGMTDEHLFEEYAAYHGLPRQSDSGLRTRRHELVGGGLVVNTGKRGKTAGGNGAIVWAAAGTPGAPLPPPAEDPQPAPSLFGMEPVGGARSPYSVD